MIISFVCFIAMSFVSSGRYSSYEFSDVLVLDADDPATVPYPALHDEGVDDGDEVGEVRREEQAGRGRRVLEPEDEHGVPEEEDKKRDADVEALHDELVVFAQDADADAHVARVEAREEDDGGRVGRLEREEEQERGHAGEAGRAVRGDPEHERLAVVEP